MSSPPSQLFSASASLSLSLSLLLIQCLHSFVLLHSIDDGDNQLQSAQSTVNGFCSTRLVCRRVWRQSGERKRKRRKEEKEEAFSGFFSLSLSLALTVTAVGSTVSWR